MAMASLPAKPSTGDKAVHHYEASPRWGSFTSASAEKLYLYGGSIENFMETKTQLTKSIQMYDPFTETWRKFPTIGAPPEGLYNGTATSFDHFFYTYGGDNRTSYSSSLNQLDTRSYTWTQLSSQHECGPMRKVGCGIIYYNNSLIIYGGLGIRSSELQAGSQFIKNTIYKDGSGWTNEIHMFNISEGTWSSPHISGTRPPPCASFSSTKISPTHAIFYGGNGHTGRCNHIFLLDLTTMHFEKLSCQDGNPHPVARQGHAAVCLGYGSDHPHLLVYGGLGKDRKVLNDVWCLNVDSRSWKEISVPGLQPRFFHSATVFVISPELTEVVVFGGCPECPSNAKYDDDFIPLAGITIMRLEKQSSTSFSVLSSEEEWILTEVIDPKYLRNKDRIRKKKLLRAAPKVDATDTARNDTIEEISNTTGYAFTMKNLTIIKKTDHKKQVHQLRLIEQMSPHWKKASDLLGLPLDHTTRIEMNHREVESCCREVMAQWLSHANGMYNYSTTWEGLCQLLEDMELSAIAENLRLIVRPDST